MEREGKLRAQESRDQGDAGSTASGPHGNAQAPADSSSNAPRADDSGGAAPDTRILRDAAHSRDAKIEKTPQLRKWQTFWRGALHVDIAKMQPWIALRNAVGVSAPLAAGIALGMPLGGLAVASGALNVAYSDGHDPYRQRGKRMLASSALCAIAVMAGGLAGHHNAAAVAVALAMVWAFGSGMAIALGPHAEGLGVISLVVLIVYSAQSLTPERALQAGGLAFVGGLIQMLLSLALWPVRVYEPERRALANLYVALGRAASSPAELMTAPPPAEPSTRAQEALAARAADHSVESERFRALLGQAERIRLRLFMLGRLLRRMRREKFGFAPAEMVESFLEPAARVMTAIGESLERNAPLATDESWRSEIRSAIGSLRASETSQRSFLAAVIRDALFQMDALAGQLRAALRMAGEATPTGLAAMEEREKARPWRMRFTGSLARVTANLSLQSAVFRHAIRLACAVAIAETLSRSLEAPRAYWLPMTTVLVLKPEFTVTFTRGLLRIAGTIAGLLLATAMFHFLPPGIGLEVVLIGAFVFLLRWVGPANYGIFGVAVSALIVLMISFTGVAPKDVILARGINTVAGGALALAAYVVWPTWERTQVGEMGARLLDAYRGYFSAVVDALTREEGEADAARLDNARLAARRARTNAVASVDRMQAEPGTRAEEAELLLGMLASSHRFVHAVMSVEAGILPGDRPAVRPEFRAFAADVNKTLEGLAAELRKARPAGQKWPDLREEHRRLTESPVAAREQYALMNVEADRMANSLNTLREQIAGWRRLSASR
jgi:uncharacterized membrane protein YccC